MTTVAPRATGATRPGTFAIVNHLLGEPESLASQFERDGYLFFRGALDAGRVLSVKRDFVQTLAAQGVVEKRGGREVKSARRFFPGYILVEMNMSDHAWHVVKNTPKVTGFVGAGAKPTPLSKDEVDQILTQVKTAAENNHIPFLF